MEKVFWKIGLRFLVLSVLMFGWPISVTIAAETVQYGGTLTYLDQSPSINPMSWDNEDIIWKHAQDNGFFKEGSYDGRPSERTQRNQ